MMGSCGYLIGQVGEFDHFVHIVVLPQSMAIAALVSDSLHPLYFTTFCWLTDYNILCENENNDGGVCRRGRISSNILTYGVTPGYNTGVFGQCGFNGPGMEILSQNCSPIKTIQLFFLPTTTRTTATATTATDTISRCCKKFIHNNTS